MPEEEKVLCYHTGCGEKYKLSENTKSSCTFHPGTPVFHDAYKGWSCCKKKCTDFTEFLNIKGCTTDFHSNIKPPEPVKPIKDPDEDKEVVQVRAPIAPRMNRPPLVTPLTTIKPNVAASLISQFDSTICKKTTTVGVKKDEITVGTTCKNGGCSIDYMGVSADHGPCIFHPGQPVFHEGMKFWSCCKKRTTDFSAFLSQVGCESGQHRWTADQDDVAKPLCRHDWHQTAKDVIVAVYAKKYHPQLSTVELNPVRVKIDLLFPETESHFEFDEELRGVIDVDKSEVEMLSTKVELKLRKAEPGSWSTLTIPKPVAVAPKPAVQTPVGEEFNDEPVDLSDVC